MSDGIDKFCLHRSEHSVATQEVPDKLWDSAEGKNFISKLRVTWVQQYGAGGSQTDTQINKAMWDKMDKLKNEIAKNMKGDKDEDDGIPEIMCGQVEGHNGVNFAEKQKKMCALLLRLMFYIEGLNGDGSIVHEGGGNTSMNQLEEGMKCIIGSVYIQKIMQLACWEQRIRDHALNAVDGHVNEMLTGRPSRSRQCVHWEFGNTCVGGFIPESKITQWMVDDSSVTQRAQGAGNAKSGPGEQGTPPPAAAKPVAAKPVPTKEATTTVATTTSSGGGGGGTGRAAAAGPKEGVQTAPAGECQGDRLLEWKHKTVYVVKSYSAEQWKKVKTVLDAFKNYMQQGKQHMDAYGANCYNVGWDDFKEDGHYFKGQTVADVVRCRLMSVALGWANGWNNSKQDKHKQEKNQTEKGMEERLRCEVVNVFGHLLRANYCPDQKHWRRGTEYAFQTFTQMKTPPQGGAPGIEGPVVDGLCTMCGYGHKMQHVDAADLDIVNWLMQDGNILAGMDKIEDGADCNTKWAQYTATKRKANDNSKVDETQIPEIKETEKKIVQEATRVIEKAKEVVDSKIRELEGKNTHQDDIATNNTAASTLQIKNNVARNLAMTIEEATPSTHKSQLEHIARVDSEHTGDHVPAGLTQGVGHLEQEDASYGSYLQDRYDVTKHGDDSSSRSRKSSLRDSSKKKSKSTMDRGNVDKSNASLNLNNFADNNGERTFDASTNFGSTESLLEERADDDDFGHDRKFGASAHFGSMDSIFEKGADDDHVSDDTKIGESTHFGSTDSIFPEGADADDSNRIQEITESVTFDSTHSLFDKRDYNDVEEKKEWLHHQNIIIRLPHFLLQTDCMYTSTLGVMHTVHDRSIHSIAVTVAIP
ncbi:hypothetical protein AK88_04687 [Plasmodium fragile]|uniref:Schizont-infected cell agglutination extracellular alpha domain-containing protein n=1 Tax=Plasmodium fragile TaxID=5857 RepID=A0A0D9QIX3_PLAFR|nr:uncharacterized protein AK88_04687 [Plasmodium fragile]KJP85656.1 hypothetical protein AK88_04687 [Plasmodium fragile]